MQKKFAILGLTAGLAGGSLAGLVISVPGIAGASSSGAVVISQSTDTTTPSDATTDTAETERGQWLKDAVQALVDDGTLTQEQADKVVTAIEAAKPEGGRGGRGGHGGMRGAGLETAATALGVTAEELRTELQAGKTIAEVAGEQGVDVATVVAAMVTEAEARLAQAVTDGKLTQAEADEKAAELEARITERVNADAPMRGGRHGRGPAAESSTES
jgi:hypothetical protein